MNINRNLLFWGSALIVYGLSLLLSTFGIHLPLLELFLGLFLIYVGCRLLLDREIGLGCCKKRWRSTDCEVESYLDEKE